MKTLKRLFSYFVPYLSIIILYLIMGAVIVSLAMLLPLIIQSIIDSVIGDAPFLLLEWVPESKNQLLAVLIFCWLLIVVLRQALGYLRSYMMAICSTKAAHNMQTDLFTRIVYQTQSFLRKENTGELLTAVNGDVNVIKTFFTGTVPQIIEGIFGFIFASIMLYKMSPFLVLTAYIFTIPLFVVSKRMRSVFYKEHHKVRQASAELSMVTQENINGIRIVKAYAQEKQEKDKFNKKNESYKYNTIHYMACWAKEYVPFAIIGHLPSITMTIIGACLCINGLKNPLADPRYTMSVSQFIAMAAYLNYISLPFTQANNWVNVTQQVITSGEKFFRLINTGASISSKKNAVKIPTESVHLTIDNLCFSSDGNEILKNINIDLPQGKTLGIVGATGSGKTMLKNLIMRFYDATSGSVKINGINVKDIDLDNLRLCFAPVIQDVFLFSDTIKKNIAFACPDATGEDVIKCAKTAQAHNFIKELPDEYDTIIGERGMGLSGGQKQRISIARALMKNSPVLIFDDATSALDMETEETLYDALNKNYSKNSRIIIAHRISSVKNCDEIIVLEKGEITERGTHDQLIKKKGKYYEIYREQYETILNSF